MADILVYAEIDDGVIHDVSLQALSLAKSLAGDGAVTAVALGSGLSEAAKSLFAHGADEVYIADDAALDGYVTRPYRKTLESWLARRTPGLFLFPASTLGSDLAASLAGALNAACALEVDRAAMDGDRPVFSRCEFDRKVLTQFAPADGGWAFASVRDGIAEAAPAEEGKTGEAQSIPVSLDESVTAARVRRRDVAHKTVNLKDARIIVAGGAGVGTAENFGLIRQLADCLNAEVGATRAVVDAGWLPADHQIGQTGATVRPDVYIACGISGAVQHRVGMMDAGKIAAINIDASAPIFRIAHYKIVGDLTHVIPKILNLLPA
jgi:electron transfer flavoprotein alpha subunit